MTVPDAHNVGAMATRPKGWKDRSMYVYAAPVVHSETGFEAYAAITQLQLPLTASFEGYVKQEYERYKTEMDDFSLIHQRKGKIKKATAQELLFTWVAGDFIVKQRVLILKAGLKRVVTFSASAAQDEYDAQEPFFNQILASLKV